MSISEPFIRRPVGTTLLTIAVALAGILGYLLLPVAPLPEVDFPVINVSSSLPGASPETMASAVATPLERQFGRIAGVTEMTSSSSLGSTNITVVFDLDRNIDAAARDIQAAINAALGQLPANLPQRPGYRKINPADAPIMIISLTSDLYNKAQMYDVAASILQQKIAQVPGVGQVYVGGGALPAVRVEVNPTAVNTLGLSLADVRAALAAANANRPKGQIMGSKTVWTITTTDQLFHAADYRNLIVAYRNGAPVRLADVATVEDSVEDVHTSGLANGKDAISMIIFRQPGANIIQVVDDVRAIMPQLEAAAPAGMNIFIRLDRTTTIRASVDEVEFTLLISIFLVILVVFAFLRSFRSTLIPSVTVPLSLLGTFGLMYLFGYSIDNLSLMALTISTGFVVDDAIVVTENITRYLEKGYKPFDAALKGASEIGFTIISISVSLIAVFIPILLMTGVTGRLFREFAVTLSFAIIVSMIISLTTTPMLCAIFLRSHHDHPPTGRLARLSEWLFELIHRFYERSLRWALRHSFIMIIITVATLAMTVELGRIIPKGFFPQQDTGRLMGMIQADQDTSAEAMKGLLKRFANLTLADPAVDGLVAFSGGGGSNTARMFISLKDLGARKLSADQVIGRLRRKLSSIPGATLYLQPVQDLRIGGHASSAQFQYTLQGDDLSELNAWAPKVLQKLRSLPDLVDVNSDQQTHGQQTQLVIDRSTASRLGITPSAIDNALYDAFGQRQVSTMYTPLNQYHVVMEAAPEFTKGPEALKLIYVPSSNGSLVPLSAFASYKQMAAPLSVNHQGQFPAITLSFNLRPGTSLSQAVSEIERGTRELGVPVTIHGRFAGTAEEFQKTLGTELWLVIAALAAVYIVLGMLYESLIHPITILSTLPSAGVGALLALLAFRTELSIIAVIGIVLLIGIVKKNAIMMIDFAIATEREHGTTPKEAIFEAALLRFRPITMTTMAALFGGLPLAIGTGFGSELRRPLGIAIVGGLIFSQAITLYTTPVIYLYLDRFRLWLRRVWSTIRPSRAPTPETPHP